MKRSIIICLLILPGIFLFGVTNTLSISDLQVNSSNPKYEFAGGHFDNKIEAPFNFDFMGELCPYRPFRKQ